VFKKYKGNFTYKEKASLKKKETLILKKGIDIIIYEIKVLNQ
jgi:hypothetical protein